MMKSVVVKQLESELVTWGEAVRAAREALGLSRATVAESADVGEQTLIRMEKGSPGMTAMNVQKVCNVLGLKSPFHIQ